MVSVSSVTSAANHSYNVAISLDISIFIVELSHIAAIYVAKATSDTLIWSLIRDSITKRNLLAVLSVAKVFANEVI